MEKTLKDKLQFKHVTRLAVRNAPQGYVEQLAAELEGIEIVAGADEAAGSEAAGSETARALLLFVNNMAEAQAQAPAAVAFVAGASADGAPADSDQPEGILWLVYPKGSSKIKTDINRDTLWPVVQQYGWRPVRQVALDAVWSAMRFRPGQFAPPSERQA